MSYEKALSLIPQGISRPTLFSVDVGNRVSRKTNDYLKFFCRTTSIPGIRYNTAIAVGHEYSGSSREVGAGVIFEKPFNITVLENAKWDTYIQLREWFDQVCLAANGLTNRNQRMSYYRSYTSDITLTKLEYKNPEDFGRLDEDDIDGMFEKTLTIKFLSAWPTNIGNVVLGTDMDNTQTLFDVSFTYESYHIEQLTSRNIVNRVISALG